MTTVGYFNSLRELGGMKRLSEDDVQTRAYKVLMSLVKRPGLAQRRASNIRELTSRVSNQDIPKYLDQLEVKFKSEFDKMDNKSQLSFSKMAKGGEVFDWKAKALNNVKFKAIHKKSGITYLILEEEVFAMHNVKTNKTTEKILWYSGYVEKNGQPFGAYRTMKASDMTKLT